MLRVPLPLREGEREPHTVALGLRVGESVLVVERERVGLRE